MEKEQNKEFEIDDFFEHAIKMAHLYSEKCDFPAPFINDGISILRNTFGEDWINERCNEKKGGSPIVKASKHPIGTYFSTAGETSLATLFELAVYLKKMAAIPGLNKVITNLKNSYASSLLQLAYAYRFMKLGVSNLTLEPKSKDGKGDIYFEHDGVAYMCECFIPRSSREESRYEIEATIEKIAKLFSINPLRIRVSIQFKKRIDAVIRKKLCHEILHIIKDLEINERKTVDDEFCSCLVESIGDSDEIDFPKKVMSFQDIKGNPDLALAVNHVPKSELLRVKMGAYIPEKRMSRVLVWLPPEFKKKQPIDERTIDLTEKIRRKLKQAKHHSKENKRLMIVQIPEVTEINNQTKTMFKTIQETIVIKHKDVAGIFAVRRIWTDKSRYKYVGVFLTGKQNDALPDKFFQTFNDLEATLDVINDYY